MVGREGGREGRREGRREGSSVIIAFFNGEAGGRQDVENLPEVGWFLGIIP